MEKDIIYSKSFKSWFGDWENDPDHSSKMVDNNGKPLICFHSSNQDFNTFKKQWFHSNDEGFFGDGFYFTFNKYYQEGAEKESKFYGNKVYKCYLNIRNPFDFEKLYKKDGEKIHTISLFLRNLYNFFPELSPYIEITQNNKTINLKWFSNIYDDIESRMYLEDIYTVDGKKVYWKLKPKHKETIFNPQVFYDSIDEACKIENKCYIIQTFLSKIEDIRFMQSSWYILQAPEEFTKILIKKGYDGVIQSSNGDEAVAFYSNQIKSAIDNNGNFSKESDNIYEKILHKNNKWMVTDHTGKKNLGTYDTKEEAEKRLKQVEYFKHKNESSKTMNNYTQFFNKYTERTVNINNVAYQANLVNAVTSYLKNNGYQVTKNSIASGCQALIKNFGKNSTGISGNYGKNNTDTSKVNNILAGVFSPKQSTVQNAEQQPQTNPQGDNGTKDPEGSKDIPPQDNLINDLAGITMLTKDELRAMASNGPISKVMANLMEGKLSKESKGLNPETKISNIQVIGTDNVYTGNKSNNNELKNKFFIMQQEDKNGQVKA